MAWNLLANTVYGSLTSGISAAATAMNVTLNAYSNAYPAGISASAPMYLTISDPDNPLINEIVKVTAVSGANVTTMVRGQRGTTAAVWTTGAIVSLNLHAQDITVRQDTINPLAGAVGAPSFYFSTDTTTGWYRSAENEMCATVSGTAVMTIKAGLVTFAAGSASVPGLNFGDADTGPYHYGTNQLGFTAGGTARFVIGSTNVSLADFNVVRNAASAMGFYSYNDATAQARTNYYCARGTEASPANLQSGDENGSFHFRSWSSGTTFNTAAKMMVLATENHSNTACGTKFVFQTTPNASTTAATALEIGQDKTLTIKGGIDHDGSTIGFYGTAPITKQTITGARNNPEGAYKNLLAAFVALGLINDSTTAS